MDNATILRPPPGARTAAYLRGLAPDLPRPVWVLQAGMVANALGNGVVLPFLVIYLHDVRGFGLGTAGLIVSVFGGVGLLGATVAGRLVDRFGARATLAGALLLDALAYGLLPTAHRPWQAALLMVAAGFGNGAFWPCNTALIVEHTPESRRHVAMSVNRMALNLGIGIGGLAGGLIATTAHPGSFTLLFVADAGTFVVFASLLVLVPPLERPARADRIAAGGYAAVFRDRVFMAFVGLNALFVLVGFAQLESTFAVFAKNRAGVTERAIGIMFLINVGVILIAQMPIVRLLAGRRRMRALALMSVVWACVWLLMLASDSLSAGAATIASTCAIALFAIGECLHAPNQGGLVSDLAKQELRGRYFAVSTSSYAVGFALGPALGGFALAVSPTLLWTGAAAGCGVAALLSLALERQLPVRARVNPVG
jgi:predicted MFS family arabinose efflux permease